MDAIQFNIERTSAGEASIRADGRNCGRTLVWETGTSLIYAYFRFFWVSASKMSDVPVSGCPRFRFSLREYIEAKPDEWSVTEQDASASKTITLRREPMLAVIDKTIRMCEQAISRNGGLGFGGD